MIEGNRKLQGFNFTHKIVVRFLISNRSTYQKFSLNFHQKFIKNSSKIHRKFIEVSAPTS